MDKVVYLQGKYYPNLFKLPLGNSLNPLSRVRVEFQEFYPPHSNIGDLLLSIIPESLYCLLAMTLDFPRGVGCGFGGSSSSLKYLSVVLWYLSQRLLGRLLATTRNIPSWNRGIVIGGFVLLA